MGILFSLGVEDIAEGKRDSHAIRPKYCALSEDLDLLPSTPTTAFPVRCSIIEGKRLAIFFTKFQSSEHKYPFILNVQQISRTFPFL